MVEQERVPAATATAMGKVLVTGGAGHLGANLVRRLLADGVSVRTLVRRDSNNAALQGLDVEWCFGDLRDPEATELAVRGCSHVYHCAASLSTVYGGVAAAREIYESNVLGTRNLLRAARLARVTRVVVTGSFSATGYDLDDPSRPANETMPFFPFARPLPYEQSKALAEHEVLKAFADGLDVVVATSCAILGPHDHKPSRMGQVLCDFARGRVPAYIPGGFEFVAARDIVQGHVLAMARGRAGQKYIIATRFCTMDELMGWFEQVTGRRRPRLRLPPALMAGIAEVMTPVLSRLRPHAPQRLTPGAVRILRMQRHADCSKARQELGYEPTDIVDAIREAYEDFVRRGLIERPRTATGVKPETTAPAASG
ncbi:MAG: NAD-dependent epimerase/dehydratase family protein [Proteobacteria bacterium]|nr:NAD-dependent epimerase/dehydratase family protein [Pseudomonadota bacterium]